MIAQYAQAQPVAQAAPGAAAGARDLVVPLQSAPPRMRFHRGAVANGAPAIDPAPPAIPGPVSSWYVAQWRQERYLGAGDLSVRAADGAAGPAYRFGTPDGRLSLDILPGADGTHRYVLSEDGGTLAAGGGSNLFLATGVAPGPSGFDRDIRLELGARVLAADVDAADPRALASGAVLAMAFVGLGVMNRDPVTGAQRFVFVQIPITNSSPHRDGPGTICSLENGAPSLLYVVPTGADEVLPFRAAGGDAARPPATRDLSAAIAGMIAHPYPCGGAMRAWEGSERVLRDWRLVGLYVGLEVENRDLRAGSADPLPQGRASLALELSRLRVTRAD